MRRLEVHGVAGLVTDGGLRDTPEIAQRNFPVYCKAPAAPISLIRHDAVESNEGLDNQSGLARTLAHRKGPSASSWL